VSELNDILKIKHHFTTAYSPKSNCTVERVNREIMKVLRSLVSEFKISWNEWASLLPLLQSALNKYKSASLAGQAPITVFTALPAYNPLAVVLEGTDAISFKQSKMKPDKVLANDLKESLEELHKKAETCSAAERARSLRKSEKYVKANLEAGDYVLVGTTQFGTQAKTAPRWIGSFRVVEALRDKGEKWMPRVKWKDYDEKTWEEARPLYQDVPDLINAYMNEKMAESKRG
jgi:hypothetical protein